MLPNSKFAEDGVLLWCRTIPYLTHAQMIEAEDEYRRVHAHQQLGFYVVIVDAVLNAEIIAI